MSVDTRSEIRISPHRKIQARVDEKREILQRKYPTSSDLQINEQARDRIASELNRERLRREIEREKGRAITDSLTGFLNGEGFDEMLFAEGRRIKRTGKSMAVVILDANYLKRINDKEGHEAGNEFLRKIANVLNESTRQSDIRSLALQKEQGEQRRVARWGGDEFGVVLADTDVEGAELWWERASTLLRENGISIGAGLQMIGPEDLANKNPQEVKGTIIQRRSEADLAMMMVAKPQSKAENRPVLVVYNNIPADVRATLPERAQGLKTVAT